jgi:CheY-like chemotaxis protein
VTASKDAGGSAEEPTTILVVDDEMDMRMLVRVIIDLANRGWSIVGEAADGAQALEVWRNLNGPPVPDVIVLDNRMPELTGLEVAERILHERPDQRIVLYSAYLDDEVRARARSVGVTQCVTKEELERLPDVIDSITSR